MEGSETKTAGIVLSLRHGWPARLFPCAGAPGRTQRAGFGLGTPDNFWAKSGEKRDTGGVNGGKIARRRLKSGPGEPRGGTAGVALTPRASQRGGHRLLVRIPEHCVPLGVPNVSHHRPPGVAGERENMNVWLVQCLMPPPHSPAMGPHRHRRVRRAFGVEIFYRQYRDASKRSRW